MPTPALDPINPTRVSPAANRRLALRLFGVVIAGLVFAYLQPPLYRAFCEWTGIYDIARPDAASDTGRSAIAPRPVRIEFDASSHDSGLRFRPLTPILQARTGEIVHATYLVENTRDVTVIGQAIPSYGPRHAGSYVQKLDCFCFKQQTFAPREVRELPVVFFVDTTLPDDVPTMTLSYTFFEVPAGESGARP